jgi:hypothetical protein
MMLVKIYVTELSPPNIDFFGTTHVQLPVIWRLCISNSCNDLIGTHALMRGC